MRLLPVSLLLAAALPFSAHAEQSNRSHLINIFVVACLNHVYEFETIPAFMQSTGAHELEPELAAHFLAGDSGRAWAIPIEMGNYVVSLTERGRCSTYARTGDAARIEAHFRSLASNAPEPLTAQDVSDHLEASGPDLTDIAYFWRHSAQDSSVISLFLTYSQRVDPSVRAIVSVSVLSN